MNVFERQGFPNFHQNHKASVDWSVDIKVWCFSHMGCDNLKRWSLFTKLIDLSIKAYGKPRTVRKSTSPCTLELKYISLSSKVIYKQFVIMKWFSLVYLECNVPQLLHTLFLPRAGVAPTQKIWGWLSFYFVIFKSLFSLLPTIDQF